LEKYENYDLNWEQDDFMDIISNISYRKDYYIDFKFINDDPLKKDDYKVWEIKNL